MPLQDALALTSALMLFQLGCAGRGPLGGIVAMPRLAANCAAMKAGASSGLMPAKESLIIRPKTAAGLANEVLAVNQ